MLNPTGKLDYLIKPTTDNREQTTENRQPITDNKKYEPNY